MSIPKIIFIIPYRNRDKQKKEFLEKMEYIMEDYDENLYKIFFIHQKDDREFNRGAMKNIGFLFIKSKYPNHYTNITLVFNDVDTYPKEKNIFDYETTSGTIKHFYGTTNALGGIFSINAKDFEDIGGFPNFWSWGYEDNMIQYRAIYFKLKIDRSNFYSIMDKRINQDFSDGYIRLVNKNDFNLYMARTRNGIHSISKLYYEHDEKNMYVNVFRFDVPNQKSETITMDLRKTNIPFTRSKGSMKMFL
tara:strand:+ start:4053 stop:4796 length:744 start_codon:yes stop_codon:yes gene_type:complete